MASKKKSRAEPEVPPAGSSAAEDNRTMDHTATERAVWRMRDSATGDESDLPEPGPGGVLVQTVRAQEATERAVWAIRDFQASGEASPSSVEEEDGEPPHVPGGLEDQAPADAVLTMGRLVHSTGS
jgi:hypothetical protein